MTQGSFGNQVFIECLLWRSHALSLVYATGVLPSAAGPWSAGIAYGAGVEGGELPEWRGCVLLDLLHGCCRNGSYTQTHELGRRGGVGRQCGAQGNGLRGLMLSLVFPS